VHEKAKNRVLCKKMNQSKMPSELGKQVVRPLGLEPRTAGLEVSLISVNWGYSKYIRGTETSSLTCYYSAYKVIRGLLRN
jgi:hypothetical protein